MDAKEFFAMKNGGKTAKEMNEDGVTISATFAESMMEEYATHVAEQKCKEQREIGSQAYFDNCISTYFTQKTFEAIKNAPLATDQ